MNMYTLTLLLMGQLLPVGANVALSQLMRKILRLAADF